MKERMFPVNLLEREAKERIDYFKNYTMAHPRLLNVYDQLINAIYHSPASLIFIIGPTGVGKTTLLRRLIQKIIEARSDQLEVDKGYIPIIGIEAMSPDLSQFDWKDFYVRTLKALSDPFVNEKHSYKFPPKLNFRHAVESALINRHPDAFYIDEAHHLAKIPSGRKLKDQPEALKSLASLAQVKLILVGTYDLLPLIDLGDQLCRRSKTIHFGRYDIYALPDEAIIYQNILKSFETHLPLLNPPALEQHWEYIFERSFGCVGIIKDWILSTLSSSLILDEQINTFDLNSLKKQQMPINKCRVILKAILDGEAKLKETQESVDELRTMLKQGRNYSYQKNSTTSNTESEQNLTCKINKAVGKPNPKRYSSQDSQNDQ